MSIKQKIIQNELMKNIISIRIDSLHKMLKLVRQGKLPGVGMEGATGVYDNKGAIFVPGEIVLEDSDEKTIEYEKVSFTKEGFQDEIYDAMSMDNATLIYPDGIAKGVNLDNGFYSWMARNILENKKAANRRKKTFNGKQPFRVTSASITKSHFPLLEPKYNINLGARSGLSSCLAISLIEPNLYYTLSASKNKLKDEERNNLLDIIDNARKPIKNSVGTVLAPPYVVTCHDTRYSEKSLTGLTRILGIGKFGEFATLSFERASKTLLHNAGKKRDNYKPEEIVASYRGLEVASVLRVYQEAKAIGARPKKYRTFLISPERELGLNLESIAREAYDRYRL